MSKNAYSEASIRVLKGLEPVQQRPGMYTRTENPLHIIQEVIDNAADEALSGRGKSIFVILHTDGSVSVEDEGSGIPVGLHPEEKVPVVEIVFTRLHAGGKFDKQHGGAYAFSGGLHGVGVSVTNALSRRMEVTVWRDKACHQIVFEHGAVVEPVHTITDNRKKSGTHVRVWPDTSYFDSPNIPFTDLVHLLRSKAVLLPGVQVHLQIEKTQENFHWHYEDGLRAYLEEAVGQERAVVPFFEGKQFIEQDDTFAPGEGAHWVVAFTAEGSVFRESYVNLIPTTAGGTHESGLRDGLFQAVKNFIDIHSLAPKGVKLLPEDVYARVNFMLSAKILDPQFQGQIKERLNSRDAVRLLSLLVRESFEIWLNTHVEHGKKIADLAIQQAQARTRASQKAEKRKSSSVAVLPGKLTDCESTDVTRTEIFLVEGDSAGGSAKMGRDKNFQAILPLRGKVLNTWEVDPDRLFANTEIHDISVAIGVDPHTIDDEVDLSNLRYGKICILSDADVDGSHIQVLLLTLFYRHFPRLIEKGHIYVARPPLFRLDVPAVGKRPMRKIYCLDHAELQAAIDKLRKEKVKENSWAVSRFKGLGEMNPEQLWETTMNPDTRRLLPVTLGDLDGQATQAMFEMLMAKAQSSQRRSWLEEKGDEAEVDV